MRLSMVLGLTSANETPPWVTMASLKSWVPVMVKGTPLSQSRRRRRSSPVQTFVIFYMQLGQRQRYELGREPHSQGVVEDARAVGVDVGKQTLVKLLRGEGWLEVEGGGKWLSG